MKSGIFPIRVESLHGIDSCATEDGSDWPEAQSMYIRVWATLAGIETGVYPVDEQMERPSEDALSRYEKQGGDQQKIKKVEIVGGSGAQGPVDDLDGRMLYATTQ